MENAAATIREIISSDAEAAARLSGELGYPASPDDMRRRIALLADTPNHCVYVACVSSDVAAQNVVGWIDIAIVHHLQSEPCAEIGGLVVTEAARSQGIGKKFLDFAEEWARARGVKRIVVRSRSTRKRAHMFYERAGFAQSKTSAVFEKFL